jgi:hypothetical protein
VRHDSSATITIQTRDRLCSRTFSYRSDGSAPVDRRVQQLGVHRRYLEAAGDRRQEPVLRPERRRRTRRHADRRGEVPATP